jgi:hypothetical protein
MIRVLIRNQLSYFQSYRNYFIAIYIAFLSWPLGDLIFILGSPEPLLKLATQGISSSSVLIALIWGYVATKLYIYPETFSLRRIFSRPFRPIFLIFGLYCIPMLTALALAWADPLAVIAGSSIHATYVLEGVTEPVAVTGSSLLLDGLVVVVAFTLYPLLVLSRRRSLVKDREVRKALKIIAVVFGVISATLVSAIAIESFGYSIIGSANFVSVILIIVAVQAFQKPTFLKSFLGVVPSLESSPSSARYDQMILIHGPGNNKFSSIAKYILEGVNQRERVIYFHNGDIAVVTEGLSREGVDVTRLMLKGALSLQALGNLYPKKLVLDGSALEVVQVLASEAKTLGNDGLRVVLDYDDFIIRPAQKFVQHLMDARWTTPDHSLHILMVFDRIAFRGEEASLAKLEGQVRTLDLAETKDAFSQEVGLAHEDIVGRKLLFEYDPQIDYERVFRSLLAENAANIERTVVFTRKESLLYSLARRQPGTKIFVLTSRVSYPKMESDNLFLLPTYDGSLLLDSLNKTIEAYTATAFTIIFDNVSHFVFTIGPERTYSMVHQALELMASDKITAIFAINAHAHDAKTLSTFENMFDFELVWGEDGRNWVIKGKQTMMN